MTDEEWTEAVTVALRLRSSDPDAAISRLRALSRQASASGRKFAGRSQAAQALALAAQAVSESGRHTEAARVFKRAAKLHKEALRHHGYGLGSSLAAASLELFKARQPEPAMRLAWEALRLFGQFPDPSSVHEQLIHELRAHLNRKGQ